jgi:hypothetical protein
MGAISDLSLNRDLPGLTHFSLVNLKASANFFTGLRTEFMKAKARYLKQLRDFIETDRGFMFA